MNDAPLPILVFITGILLIVILEIVYNFKYYTEDNFKKSETILTE